MSGANDETDLGEYIQTSAEALEQSAMRNSHAVTIGDCVQRTAETQPLPEAVAKKPTDQKSPAEWAYERLILYIENFEAQLDSEHEVALGMTGSDAGTMHIQGLGFFAPDLIAFYGVDDNGANTQMIQHVSQLNVLFRAVPKREGEQEANRIGFQFQRALGNA